jgi:hypothetical protein
MDILYTSRQVCRLQPAGSHLGGLRGFFIKKQEGRKNTKYNHDSSLYNNTII